VDEVEFEDPSFSAFTADAVDAVVVDAEDSGTLSCSTHSPIPGTACSLDTAEDSHIDSEISLFDQQCSTTTPEPDAHRG